VPIHEIFIFFNLVFLKLKKTATWQVYYVTCQANRGCFQFYPSISNFDLI